VLLNGVFSFTTTSTIICSLQCHLNSICSFLKVTGRKSVMKALQTWMRKDCLKWKQKTFETLEIGNSLRYILKVAEIFLIFIMCSVVIFFFQCFDAVGWQEGHLAHSVFLLLPNSLGYSQLMVVNASGKGIAKNTFLVHSFVLSHENTQDKNDWSILWLL